MDYFTTYIAIFAVSLAAVNIFNAYINKPYISTPLENSVKEKEAELSRVKEGIKLSTSKEKIESKKKSLLWCLWVHKIFSVAYNVFVLAVWYFFTVKLFGKDLLEKKKNLSIDEFNSFIQNDLYFFVKCITYSTISIVIISILIAIIAKWFSSGTSKIIKEDKLIMIEANSLEAKSTSRSDEF